ncbi:MAG: PASTA domain-containing protein [Clostridia bacterium]|nr:PASTA domain-containing protein [Clostridia bacterium]
MVTAVSTIANGGNHVTPRVVKQIIDSKTGEVKDIEVKKQEGVISKKTSEDVLSMMKSVVAEGTGKNAKVEGYSIGGKTGTSEDGVNTGKYVTSFIGVAPIEDPEVVVLVTLYNPTGEGGHQGGGVAAPVGGQIFSEVLPYLEVQKEENEEDMIMEIEVPNLIGLTIKEAKDKLKELDLEIEYEKGEEEVLESEITIKEQLPKPGIKIKQKNKIIVEVQ